MKSIICIGDLHLDVKEPFFSAGSDFINWFLKNSKYNSKENILILLGDVYHHSNPNPRVHDLAIHFLKECTCKKKIILAGNHDYNRTQESWSIQPLSKIEEVELVFEKKFLFNFENSGINLALMPFIYDKTGILKENNFTQKNYYEQTEPEAERIDYIFHHLEDETISFGGEFHGVNLNQYSNAKRIGGHIHIKQKGYLGTPLITRYDERKKESFILEIDLETKKENYIKVPNFLDYCDISYDTDDETIKTYDGKMFDESGDFLLNQFLIFDIKRAPSEELAREKFKDFFIREVEVSNKRNKNKQELGGRKEFDSKKSIIEHCIDFCDNKNVKNIIKEKVIGVLKEESF